MSSPIQPAPIVAVNKTTRVYRVWHDPFEGAFSILVVEEGDTRTEAAVWWLPDRGASGRGFWL